MRHLSAILRRALDCSKLHVRLFRTSYYLIREVKNCPWKLQLTQFTLEYSKKKESVGVILTTKAKNVLPILAQLSLLKHLSCIKFQETLHLIQNQRISSFVPALFGSILRFGSSPTNAL